jgi:hypothetical protein
MIERPRNVEKRDARHVTGQNAYQTAIGRPRDLIARIGVAESSQRSDNLSVRPLQSNLVSRPVEDRDLLAHRDQLPVRRRLT